MANCGSLRILASSTLIFTLTALGSAHADESGLRQSLQQTAGLFAAGQTSMQARRQALVGVTRQIRAAGGLRRVAPDIAASYRNLSDQAFQLKNGAPKTLYKTMATLELAQRAGTMEPTKLLKSLGKLGSQLKRIDPQQQTRLADRFARSASLASFERLTSPRSRSAKPSANTSVEAETRLTDSLLQLMNVKGDGSIAPLLQQAKLQRPSKLTAEQRTQRQTSLDAAKKTMNAATAGHWAKLSGDEQRAYRTVWRADAESAYDQALTAVEQLASRRGRKLESLTWDEVGSNIGAHAQKAILAAAVADKGGFSSNRDITLMEFPSTARPVRLGQRLVLDGKVLGPGQAQLPSVFLPKVEFMSPEDASNLHGIEAHRVKRHGRAGDNSTETYQVIWALGSNMRHQHLHIPFRPAERMRTASGGAEGGNVLLTDHWRRANLFGELLAAARFGQLAKVGGGGVTYFDYSNDGQLQALNTHLKGERQLYGSELKMGAVGYRTGIYRDLKTGDKQAGVEGYEVRAINVSGPNQETSTQQALRESWLNAIQRSLSSGYLGVAPTALKGWYKSQLGDKASTSAQNELLRGLHYNRSVDSLINQAPAHLKGALTADLQQKLRSEAGDNYGLKLLVHDWSRDTVWLALTPGLRQKAQARVQSAQLEALQAYGRGDSARGVVTQFVNRSGLLGVAGRSLGMNDVAGHPLAFQ